MREGTTPDLFGEINLDLEPDVDRRRAAVELRHAQTRWADTRAAWLKATTERQRATYRAWKAGWTLMELCSMLGLKYPSEAKNIIDGWIAKHDDSG